MVRDLDLEVGNWYRSEDGLFEIVAWDGLSETVEIQYYDGSIEELDIESWDELEAKRSAPPEDWAGPFDDIERADLDEGEAAVHPGHRNNLLNEVEF